MADYRQVAAAAAARYGIDANVFLKQINQESGFNPNAQSSAGAQGIAQIVPRWHPGVNPMDPVAALDYAAKWDSQLLKQYEGDWRQALSVYNSGQPDKYADPNFARGQTYNYVRNILAGQNGAPATAATPQSPQVPAAPAAVAPAPPPNLPGVGASTSAPMQSSSSLPLLQMISANQQAAGLPGLSPLLLALASSSKAAPAATAAPAVPTAPAHVAAPKVQVQGNVTGRVKGAVNLVQEYLGTPYVWGGEKPGGFDCSGLLQYVWGKVGVSIPRTTYDQFQKGTPVAKAQLQPGDAVFFTGSDPKGGLPGHVGMYLGAGKFVEAPHTGATVRISNLAGRSDFAGGRRYA